MCTMLWEYIVYNMLFILLLYFPIIKRNLNFILCGANDLCKIIFYKKVEETVYVRQLRTCLDRNSLN